MLRISRPRILARRRFFRPQIEALEPRALLAAFTPGNLVVSRLGDGGGLSMGNSQPVMLVELTTAGANVGNAISIPAPSTDNSGGLTDNTSQRNGQLNRSADGRYLTLMGYDAAVGRSMVNNTSATTINRNIARVDGAGTVSIVARLTDGFGSGNNPSSAVTDTGSTYYAAGGNFIGGDGVRYVDTSGGIATTSTQLATEPWRDILIATDAAGNKFLVYSSPTGVSYFAGFPTSAATGTSLGVTLTEAGAFVLFDRSPTVGATGLGGLDTLYVSDCSSSLNDATAILRKFEWNGASWADKGTATMTAPGTRLYGLTAQVVAGGVQLFATTAVIANNSLVSIIDTSNGGAFGGDLGGNLSVIASAGANYVFRGAALAPIGAPPVGTSLAIAATDASKAEGNTGTSWFTFTVTRTGNADTTVNWTLNHVTSTAADFSGAVSGAVSFGAGDSTKTITVNVVGDTAIEANETFSIALSDPTGGATISTATAGGTILNDDFAPTLATAAAATPSPATGTTTSLSVLGADDGGEANLTYTWSITSKPAGAADPTFLANGVNAAKSSTATFSQAGDYGFLVTIRDVSNLTVTSAVNVTVSATLTNIAVTPTGANVPRGGSQQYVATGSDQFGNVLAVQPTFTWSVLSGPGSIVSSGLYTASNTAGPYQVQAASGGKTGSASGTVLNAAPTVATAAAAAPQPAPGIRAELSVLGVDDGGEAALTYSWSIVSKPAAAADPVFSASGTNGAKNSAVTVAQSGNYVLRATISDGLLTVTSDVALAVDFTLGQNQTINADVNHDSLVNVQDILAVIGYLAQIGPSATSIPSPGPVGNPALHYDVNADGIVSVIDILGVINYMAEHYVPPEGEGVHRAATKRSGSERLSPLFMA